MKELITYPLNDVDYSAEEAGLFHCTRKSGVWYQDSFPIEVSGADNTIFIGKGLAWFSNTEFWGKVAAQKTKVSLDLEYADPVYDRIDIIALQFDANKNATNLIVKKGEAKTNPTIPSISRTEAVYELYLYAITRPAASLTVTSENVRDLRLDDAYCGLMADSVTSLDFPVVPVEKGGTGETTVAGIKKLLSLGKVAFLDLLSVALGGTGKSTHTANSVLTGNGTNAINNVPTANGAFFATGTNGAPKFATLPIAQGGTGATSIAGVRNNLGLGNTSDALPITNGGTGATSVTAARSNLGLNDKLFIQYPINGCNIDSTDGNWTVDIAESGHGTIPADWVNVTQTTSGHFAVQIAVKCNKDTNTGRASGNIWIRDKYIGGSGGEWSTWTQVHTTSTASGLRRTLFATANVHTGVGVASCNIANSYESTVKIGDATICSFRFTAVITTNATIAAGTRILVAQLNAGGAAVVAAPVPLSVSNGVDGERMLMGQLENGKIYVKSSTAISSGVTLNLNIAGCVNR